MRAMVLAAGEGTRLRPLTLQRAKPALRFVDRPLICRTLRWLSAAGVDEAVVNLHHLPETVRAAIEEDAPPLRLHYSEEPRILGTAGGLGKARGFFGGVESFLLVNGDCFYDLDLTGALEAHGESGAVATMLLMENPDPAAFAGVEVDTDGVVRRIAGQPEGGAEGLRSLHFIGIHILAPEVLGEIPEGVSDMNHDVYQDLIRKGVPVRGHRVSGSWHDIGTPHRFLEGCMAELARAGGAPYLAEGARLDREVALRSGCVIGAGGRVGGGACVEGSVVLDGAAVGERALVRGSVIGYGTDVAPGERVEGMMRVLLPRGVVETPIG
jgi:NDP-sugar pyrophosphorylase family protein